MKIGIDLGGVLSKYPKQFKELIEHWPPSLDIFIVSDMYPVEKIKAMLELNNIYVPSNRVISDRRLRRLRCNWRPYSLACHAKSRSTVLS